MKVKLENAVVDVLAALANGDEEMLQQALNRQREAFKEKFGCYPEECEVIDNQDGGIM